MVNFAVIFGARMRGPLGALAAVAGLLGPPMILIIAVGALYAQFGDLPALRRMLTGVAAAGAGLMLATVAKMLRPIFNGYHVAGIAGAVVATLAMCGPTSLLAFVVGRASERFTGTAWHGALSRGLVPVTLGLTAASATVIVSVADTSWVAAAITLATAAIAFFMRIHPLWAFAVAALLGLAGLV
jgi:chromate transport protein ChrA